MCTHPTCLASRKRRFRFRLLWYAYVLVHLFLLGCYALALIDVLAGYAQLRFAEYYAWKGENDGSREISGKQMPLRERVWDAVSPLG